MGEINKNKPMKHLEYWNQVSLRALLGQNRMILQKK